MRSREALVSQNQADLFVRLNLEREVKFRMDIGH